MSTCRTELSPLVYDYGSRPTVCTGDSKKVANKFDSVHCTHMAKIIFAQTLILKG